MERNGGRMNTEDSSPVLKNTSFSSVSSFVQSHKRGGLIVFSAVTAASVIAIGVNAQSSSTETPKQSTTVQTAADTETPLEHTDNLNVASDSTIETTTSGTTAESANSSNVQLNVNGQDIPVPQNGSTQQTVPSSDGSSQTSVNVTTNGDANSASSLNVNLNLSTNSSNSGFSSQQTVVTQNGNTTFSSSP